MFKKIFLFVVAVLLVTLGLTFTNRFAHLKNFATWGVHTIHDHKTHPVRVVETPTPDCTKVVAGEFP